MFNGSFGVADRAFNVPCTNDTKYKIASITKAFTSVLILQLVEEKKIDLDQPIKAYLPNYSGEGAGTVKIRILLNHTSGLPNADAAYRSVPDALAHGMPHYQLPATPDQLIDRYYTGKLLSQPGKVFSYNNADYIILRRIIEVIDSFRPRCHAADCAGIPQLWMAAHDERVTTARVGGNHKRVYRLMREDNLLCLRKRKFIVTTDSDHPFPVYPNLAAGMKLTNVNQLWVADITYIRLLLEFVYLAVILDAFSRRGVGWALGRTLETTLTLRALRMALERRRPAPGLVHHSDRGVQYAAKDYVAVLRRHGIEISMSRRGNPFDNAICESFMKTLKYEQVYREDYRVFEEAERGIDYFIDDVYNEKRLHSALRYLPPAEFEASLELRAGARVIA